MSRWPFVLEPLPCMHYLREARAINNDGDKKAPHECKLNSWESKHLGYLGEAVATTFKFYRYAATWLMTKLYIVTTGHSASLAHHIIIIRPTTEH